MYLWTLQKKIKIKDKIFFVFYIVNNNTVICRLGYIMYFKDIILVKINLKKFLIFLFYYKGYLSIRESIYLKFFILSYFYLISINKWKNIKFN
jgi:hypothetical protein